MTIANTGFSYVVGTNSGGPGTLSVTVVAGETLVAVVYGGLAGQVGVDPHLTDGTTAYTLLCSFATASGNGSITVYKIDGLAAGTYGIYCGYYNTQASGYPVCIAIGKYTGVNAGACAFAMRDAVTSDGSSANNMVLAAVTPGSAPGLCMGFLTNQNVGSDTDIAAGTGFTLRAIAGTAAIQAPTGWEEMAFSGTAAITPTFSETGHGYQYSPSISIALENASVAATNYNAGSTETGYASDQNGVSGIQILVPSSLITAGAWTPSTGVTLYGTINETSPNDTDYDSVTSASTFEVLLGPGTNPGTSSGYSVLYRAFGSGTLTVALVQGTTIIASTSQTMSGSYTTYTMTLTSGQIAAITDWTNLRLRFTSN